MTLHFLLGAPDKGSLLPQGLAGPGRDGAAVAELVPNVHLHDVYVCGPERWMDLVHRSLADAGVPSDQVHDERFVW